MAVLGRRRPGHARRRVQGSANCDQAATLKLRRAILRRPYRHSVHATISSVIGIEVSQASLAARCAASLRPQPVVCGSSRKTSEFKSH